MPVIMAEAGFMPLRIEEVAAPDVLTDALRFRRSMQIDTVGILLFDPDGMILRANEAFLRMSGYTQDDVHRGHLHWTAITPPEWKQATLAALREFEQTGSIIPYEKQFFRKDRSRFWGFVASKRLSETEGIAFVVDVTERKEAERRLLEAQLQLERSDSQLQTITDAMPALIAYVDPKLRYIRVNRAYAHFFGREPEALVGQSLKSVLGEAFPEIEARLQLALAGETQQYELTLPCSNPQQDSGEPRHLFCQQIPDISPEGHVLGIVIQSFDLTERRRTEHMLRTAEKLAAVGRLAASMAHEINNPLEAVTNLLYLARGSEDRETTQVYLEQAEGELRRVAAITSQTLRFHKQSTRPVALHAEELLGSVLAIYATRILNGGVQVTQRLNARTPVMCFDGEIRQVLSNLISNALDAMAGRTARLTLRASVSTILSTDPLFGQGAVRITVADNGPGMSRAVLDRLWEAFFTTKEVGGTGLGLWISRDIVERHGGRIRVRSQEGTGTVFMLWLPLEAVGR